jgi:hypothetical protein
VSAKNSDLPLTIFTLSSARSGTLYLRNLFRNNVRGCVCRHEPFFDWGNPTMFGPAIYDAHAGRLDRIRARLARKRDYIAQLRTKAYLESSHAFLKSSHVAALEFFPDLRLIHLIRDPLMVAKSEAIREQRRRSARVPFHYYRGDDGRRHFYWSLTTNEEIYQSFDRARLSLFQKYLIQWIEIENRAMRFLDVHRLHDRCFTLDSPRDLNTAAKIQELLDFLGLETRHHRIVLGGRRNVSLGHTTVIHAEDRCEVEEVLEKMPARFLEIFRREPYTRFGWNARFRILETPPEIALQNVAG